MDEDAKTFLSDPKNRRSATKKRADDDDVSVMTDSATVEVGATSGSEEPSVVDMIKDYYCVRKLLRKQKRPDRRTDPVTFTDLAFTMDYDEWFANSIDKDLQLIVKGPLSNLHFSFTADNSIEAYSCTFIQLKILYFTMEIKNFFTSISI